MHFLFIFLLFCVSLLGQSKPVMPIFEAEQQPIEWTEPVASNDARIVYVDSVTGNDANSGLTELQAKATINAGYLLLRDGFPDWLLLKRGTTYTENLQWNKSGRSNTERMIIGAYGNISLPRPIIIPDYAAIFHFFQYRGFRNVNILSLDIKNDNYNPFVNSNLTGISLLGPFFNILIEDVRTTGMGGGIVIFNPNPTLGDNVVIRRCQILNAYSAPSLSHAQGIYASTHRNFVVEECLLDHNGWKEGDPTTQTIFNHNLYYNAGGNPPKITFRNNISARSSSHGIQARTGAIMDNNLFYQNPLSMLIGSSQSPLGPEPSVVSNNVVIDGRDIYTSPRGNGLDIVGGTGHVIVNNIFKDRLTGSGMPCISISGSYIPVRNLNLTRNIISNWRAQSFYFSGSNGSVNQVVFRQNEIYEPTSQLIMDGPAYPQVGLSLYNKYFNPATQPFLVGGAYRTPTQYFSLVGDVGSTYSTTVPALQNVNLDTYYNTLRNTNTGAIGFLTEARENRKGSWDPTLTAWAVNNYIRSAYGR